MARHSNENTHIYRSETCQSTGKSYIDVTAHVSADLSVDVYCSFTAIQMVDYLSQ